jgi:hypothetical protein
MAVQDQAGIDESVYTHLASESRDRIVVFAIEAGLDPNEAGASRKLVAEQFAALEAVNEVAQQQQQEMQNLPRHQQQIALELMMLEGQMEIVRAGRTVRKGIEAMLTAEQRQVWHAKLRELEPPNR